MVRASPELSTTSRNGELFGVDVNAEIRKLTERRFKSKSEYCVELVALAASFAPSRIEVELNRRYLAVRCDCTHALSNLVKRLAVVVDPSQADDERHQNLIALEEEWGLGILAAFAKQPRKVEIVFWAGDHMQKIVFMPHRPPRRMMAATSAHTSFVVYSKKRDIAAEKRILKERCRFAQLPISVNGKQISQGLKVDDCLIQVEITNPRLRAVIGLPLIDDVCRIHRLRHGIIGESRVRPVNSGLLFHAVVHEKDRDFAQTWGTLTRAAERLYQRVGPRLAKFNDLARKRALELLFERHRSTGDERLLAGARIFKRAFGRPYELQEVLAASKRGPIHAVDVDASLDRYDISDQLILRLDHRQRRFLEQLAEVELDTPPLRARTGGIGVGWLTRIGERLQKISRWIGQKPGEMIPETRLNPRERAFLDAVRGEIRSGAFALPDEPKPFKLKINPAVQQKLPWVRVDGSSNLRHYQLGIDHPLVARMIRAFSLNSAYLYPALFALTAGHDGYANARDKALRVMFDRLASH